MPAFPVNCVTPIYDVRAQPRTSSIAVALGSNDGSRVNCLGMMVVALTQFFV